MNPIIIFSYTLLNDEGMGSSRNRDNAILFERLAAIQALSSLLYHLSKLSKLYRNELHENEEANIFPRKERRFILLPEKCFMRARS